MVGFKTDTQLTNTMKEYNVKHYSLNIFHWTKVVLNEIVIQTFYLTLIHKVNMQRDIMNLYLLLSNIVVVNIKYRNC